MEAKNLAPWINEDFLKTVLEIDMGNRDDISIIKYDVTTADVKGGGYLSVLHRVTVQYTVNNLHPITLSLIIKSQPTDHFQIEFSKNVNAFLKEITMYEKILPAMNRLAGEKLFTFSPKCFLCPKSDVLILEDLKKSGFSLLDRRERLDFEQSLLVIRSIAKFHALSIVLHREDPKIMETFSEGHYTKLMNSTVESFHNQTFDALIFNVEKWEGLGRFVNKLDKLASKATDVMVEQTKPKEGEFKIVSNDKVEDVRFFDFQLARFTSPAIDLHFFLYLNLQEQVLFQRFSELIQEYHSELSNTLQCCGYDSNLITLAKLKEELKRTEKFALITACTKLWFVVVNPGHVDDIVLPNDFSRGTGMFNSLRKVYSDSVLRKYYEQILPYFERKGLL
ncbi:hypothetical protein L9F63_021836 [Diploptera punctata]|uniref:CHK kinase-like domain-containing protein n=1 Tax=Diploptera punctata TaxID=6984 RepID=A0AAD7ZNL8_DIPPU|nr:hypothetical protein L9F63_021836 [Diploptera punctata]